MDFRAKLAAFYDQHRRMPSFTELMSLWGYKTKSAVAYRVRKLIDAGMIGRDGGRLVPRNLEIGAKVLGLVEAGFPSPAEEELLDVMSFDEYLTPNKESSYILKVKGDSMIEAGIMPGDMVVVERRASYKSGQIVVASIDSEYTMKYLRKDARGFYLEPANRRYRPMRPRENFKVEAVVVAVVRKL